MAADHSQTDLEVLKGSNRSKFISLGVLLALAAGVFWYARRPGPIGASEDLSKVLVVTQSHHRYKPYLTRWGFGAQEGRAQTIIDEAQQQLPDEKLDGVPAILKLADWAGFAFVAFERPASVDFSGVSFADELPAFLPHHRFAVVSIGDYAFPHKLTVNAEPSRVMRGVDLDLLSALFAQQPLADTLDTTGASPDALVLRTKVMEGIHRLTAVQDAEATIAKIADKAEASLTTDEKGQPAPTLLGGIHESLQAVPLADGSTLMLSRAVHFSSTGYNAELELDQTWEFTYLAPGATPGSEREPCSALLGGSLEESGARPLFRTSPRGDAILIHVDGASQIWRLDHGAGKPLCNFVEVGKIEVPLVRGEDPGDPQPDGQVVRGRSINNDWVIYTAKPGDAVANELIRTTQIRFGVPGWIGDNWIAAPGISRHGYSGLYLFSPNHPDHALRLDSIHFDAATSIHEVAPAPAPNGAPGPRLLVTASDDRGQRLYRVDAAQSWDALFASALATPSEPAPAPAPAVNPDPFDAIDNLEDHDDNGLPEGPRILNLDPTNLTLLPLTREGWVRTPVAAPDGSAVVFQVSDIDNGIAKAESRREIASVSLDGSSPLRLLTRNGLDDHTPHFSADSNTVVFHTRFSFDRTKWNLTTARAIPVR